MKSRLLFLVALTVTVLIVPSVIFAGDSSVKDDWGTGDIVADGGYRIAFIFGSPDITASMNKGLKTIDYYGGIGSGLYDEGPIYYRMPFNGSVIGISTIATGDPSTGIASFDVTINGTKTGLIAQVASGGTTYKTQLKDTSGSTFSAGDLLGVNIQTGSNFTPSGSPDVVICVFVEM